MRLIDADKFEAFMYNHVNDDFDNGVQFVLEMIDKAPTACDIDVIKAEIEQKTNEPAYQHEGDNWGVGLEMALDIIDKHIKGESK